MSLQNNKCTKCNGKKNIKCPTCNGTGKKQDHIFKTIPLTTWKEIKNIEDIIINIEVKQKMKHTKWIFRGQSNADWTLKTSLERFIHKFPKISQDKKKTELFLCREFRRRYHHYSSDIPTHNDFLEWFSLMQHFGAPSRLLDFTYSPYIAAYFALEKKDIKQEDIQCAVWAINARWAVGQSAYKFEGNEEEYGFLKTSIMDGDENKFINTFMAENPKQFVTPINPFRLNERITIQKGTFMCLGDVTSTFQENLCALKDYENNVRKFNISLNPEDWRKSLDSLYDLNITRANLFPGLDGFAQSLSVFPPKVLLPEN